jgi:hypothetical protein
MNLFRKSKPEPKVFCIGCNKTGTTSIETALRDFGYKMGNQEEGEKLIDNYLMRDFSSIIDYCKTAEAFQDIPFSFHYTFMAIDQAFPNAKFILTFRDSEEQWYNSLVKFHFKIFKKNRIPTYKDVLENSYRYPGFMWKVRNKVFGIEPEMDMYDEQTWTNYYNEHNKMVREYFKLKNNLLEINLSDKKSYLKLAQFLNKKPLYEEFPWENKSH